MSKNLGVQGNGIIKGDLIVGLSRLDYHLYVDRFSGNINMTKSLKVKKDVDIENDITITGRTIMMGDVNLNNIELKNIIINNNMSNSGRSSLYNPVGFGIDYPSDDSNLILYISGNTRLDGNLILTDLVIVILPLNLSIFK